MLVSLRPSFTLLCVCDIGIPLKSIRIKYTKIVRFHVLSWPKLNEDMKFVTEQNDQYTYIVHLCYL